MDNRSPPPVCALGANARGGRIRLPGHAPSDATPSPLGALIVAFGIVVLLGMAALAVDTACLRLAQTQTQDVADAASQAAVFVLRRTGDLDEATAAAEDICERNEVAGQHASLETIEFGTWDDTVEPGVFTATEIGPNAVKVTVARAGEDAVPFLLGRVFGQDTADVRSSATSASRSLHVCLAMDITNSWNHVNFHNARTAATTFLDTMEASYGEHDKIGMTVFTGRYAWEFTPMTLIEDEVSSGAIMADWSAMETASKAGRLRGSGDHHHYCRVYSRRSHKQDKFSSPSGGCFPNMPREYSDEPGTDHTTGIQLCETMFDEETGPTAYRAMVVLTDGMPNGIRSGHGNKRVSKGHSESRWREYEGPAPHTTTQIKNDSNDLTQEMWDDLRVHTWVVSFVKDGRFMHTMPKGDGYYSLTSDSGELATIFEDIANSLPIAIVE